MFGRKTKPSAVRERNPYHQEIRLQAGTLISVANRVEARSTKGGEPTVTNATEVIMARELLAAQQNLHKAIEAALLCGLTVEDLQSQVFEPVMERSVVGDVAWIMMQNVIRVAKEGKPRTGKARL